MGNARSENDKKEGVVCLVIGMIVEPWSKQKYSFGS